MNKLTYLLVQTAVGAAYPIAVSGASGKLYGHAELALPGTTHFSRFPHAHVFSVSKEEYEGPMARDIALVGHRSFGKWMIFAEVEADPESADALLAGEIDRLKAELAQREGALAAATAEIETLTGLLTNAPMRDAGEAAPLPPQIPATVAETPDELEEKTQTRIPEPPPVSDNPAQARLEAMSFREVRAEAQAAGVNVAKIKTKDGMIAALLALAPAEK